LRAFIYQSASLRINS